MGVIYLAYREDDTAAMAGRIYDRLVGHFGAAAVRREAAEAGQAAGAQRGERLRDCAALLVVIGPEWSGNGDDARRVGIGNGGDAGDAGDRVLRTVEEGLRRGIPVLPLLVQGATLPGEDALPPGPRGLAGRDAVPIRYDPDFDKDVRRMLGLLERLTPELAAARRTAQERRRRARRVALVGGLALLAIVAAGVAVLLAAKNAPTTGNVKPTPAPTATPTILFSDTLSAAHPAANLDAWPSNGTTACEFGTGDHGYFGLSAGACLAPHAADATDGILTVDALQIQGEQTLPYGVVFRADGDGNPNDYYAFEVTSDGHWQFVKSVDGTQIVLTGPTRAAAIHTGLKQWNRLRVRATDTHFVFAINGATVGQADDSTYAAGQSGVYSPARGTPASGATPRTILDVFQYANFVVAVSQ